jgi:hypothetical protein
MTTKKSVAQSPGDLASLQFLYHDFDQCFEQMRYYDNQIISIFKFVFVTYTFLTGIVTSLYQFFAAKALDLYLPAILTLSVGLVLGVFIFAVILRNRIYFVRTARYVNEIRELFLMHKPLGFENHTQMYTRYDEPRYFNWLSSQSWLIYIVAFLNSMVLFVIGLFAGAYPVAIYTFMALFFFAIQIASAVVALKARE